MKISKDKILSFNYNYMMFIILIIQPILDIVSYFAVKYGYTSYTTIIRMIFFMGITLYSFYISKRKKIYIGISGVIAIFWILHMVGCWKNGYQSIPQDIAMYLRTIQMPIFTLNFITIFEKEQKYTREIEKAYVTNYIIIISSIILSFLIGMPEYTYYGGIGIKGWFAVGNSQSCIVSIMAPLGLCFAYRKKNKILFCATLLLECVNMYFFGTRVAFFSIYIVCISFAFFLVWNKKKDITVYGSLFIALVVCSLFYKYPPCYVNQFKTNESFSEWNNEISKIKEDNKQQDQGKIDKKTYLETYNLYCEDLVKKYGLEKVIKKYNYSTDSSDVISNRKLKINYNKLNMDEKGIWEHAFGYEYMEFIYNGTIYDPENDFPALYFQYGYVGVALYIIFILYFAIITIKYLLQNWSVISIELGSVGTSLILMLGIAQYSGNVLRRPNVSIYLSVMLAYIYYLCKMETNVREKDVNEQ